MLIREAKTSDSRGIQALCTNDLGYPCGEELVAQRIAGLDRQRECVFVAEAEGAVVGFVHVERYDLLYHPGMANILGLAVSGPFRRRGTGAQLMLAAEAWAKSRGIGELRLNSGGSRREAHAFYRKLGFDDEKTQLRFLKKL